MAYARDRDHLSRGVGAIAAVDNVSPRARARKLAIARATMVRDRKLVALSGDHRASGVSSTSKASSSKRTAGTVDHRTGAKSPAPGAPPAAAAPGTYGPAATFTDGPPPAKTPYPGMPRRSVTVEPPVGTPPAPRTTSTPPTSSAPTPSPTTITVSGGSGGSSSTSTPTTKPTTTAGGAPSTISLPDIPESEAGAESGVSTRTLLIAGGGIALVAYLLLRKATP